MKKMTPLCLLISIAAAIMLSFSAATLNFSEASMMDEDALAEIQAACAHTNKSEQYCEATHPHANFRYCTDCWKKFYTGGYTTKSHGDGSTGSGTCPDCGSHRYVGRTCERPGTCACGDTVPAAGHVYSPIYSEAAHPHKYYEECSVCHYIHYTGGHATKNHGDGTWGSGTCPDCGTHTYVGKTCTTNGACACGAILEAVGHTPEGSVYYENEHPHRYFKVCSTCSGRVYTGEKKTLPHGDGTDGTCMQCGFHVYEH